MTQYEHIQIDGSPAFILATQRALALLRATPSWSLAQSITRIRELENEDPSSGGYLFGTEFNVAASSWQASPTYYASQIAHEGSHASNGHGWDEDAEAAERVAFTDQAKALRELGASWAEISHCERHAAQPTHHVQWAQNPQSGRSGTTRTHTPSTSAAPDTDRPMGVIERMAHAYHASARKGWFS